jgi:hypothetical protein
VRKIADYITENERRKAAAIQPYNPLTGEGCYGERFLVSLPDCPQGDVWLPVEMQNDPGLMNIIRAGSLQNAIEQISPQESQKPQSPRESQESQEPQESQNPPVLPTPEELWLIISQIRFAYDFEYFAVTCEIIREKKTGKEIPFILNAGQRKVLAELENMRRAGLPIRIVILKSRQWGCSTLIQMYILWMQVVIKTNWNSVICSHRRDSAANIRAMFNDCINLMPPINGVKLKLDAFGGTANIRHIKKRGCRITIGTAKEPESVRSQDVKIAHFSEVPYYPATDNNNSQKLIASIISSIPFVADTMIVYESTACGIGGFFYDLCLEAEKGASANAFVFVAWHETGELCTEPFDGRSYIAHNGQKVSGSVNDFVKTLSEYECLLFDQYPGVTLEHINFYRTQKIHQGDLIYQEYPSNPLEAFKSSGSNAFREEHIVALRDGCSRLPVAVGTMAADSNASEAVVYANRYRHILKNVRFIPDTDALELARLPRASVSVKERERRLNNKLVIWAYPDTEQSVANRYIVVYDPARGTSDAADWGCICVLDRYWRMYNGLTEVVAEWRGHEDLYIAVWIAAQIAVYYNSALLVIECNTFNSLTGRAVATEFIFETIKEHYFNLYAHTDAQKVREGKPARYGFFTGNNKANLVQHYYGLLAEHGYVERSHNTLDQALVYEFINGKYAARHGYHDDDLMTRMIGLYIDHRELPLPILRDAHALARLQAHPTNFTDI